MVNNNPKPQFLSNPILKICEISVIRGSISFIFSLWSLCSLWLKEVSFCAFSWLNENSVNLCNLWLNKCNKKNPKTIYFHHSLSFRHLNFGHLNLFRISSFVFRILLPPVPRPLTPIVVPPDSLQNLLKTCSFLSISVQFLLKTDKKVQKSANFCSFLPSFFDQKQISPIKSHFLLPSTIPFFKISLKNPYFPLFSNFFLFFFPLFYLLCFCFSSSDSCSFNDPERKPCRSIVTNLKPSAFSFSTTFERIGSAATLAMSFALTSIRAIVS